MVALVAQQSNTSFPIDEVLHGDCLEVLRSLPDNSVDAIVSDPPAGIAFMGKDWDNFSGKQKTYDSASARNASYDAYGKGALPYGFSSSSGQPTKKERDAFIAFMTSVMSEALRVLKPGGYGLIWALPRTSHWTALALEDAGFIVKDCVSHIFGSGFPKSMDISKAIDKMQGAEREVIGLKKLNERDKVAYIPHAKSHFGTADEGKREHEREITAPATPEAQQHAGKGTALKPSTEFWWLVQKPISEKTIAANVLKWGTGGLAIDKCRVGMMTPEEIARSGKSTKGMFGLDSVDWKRSGREPQGRFPSHLLLSHSVWCMPRGVKRVRVNDKAHDRHNGARIERTIYGDYNANVTTGYADPDGMEEVEDWECVEDCPVRILNEQSGIRKSGGMGKGVDTQTSWFGNGSHTPQNSHASEGGASRYFQTFHYFSKASRAERNQGCEGLQTDKPDAHNLSSNACGRCGLRVKANGSGVKCECGDLRETIKLPTGGNGHPTVKSLSLMSWLCRLITPPDGIVLDPFLGSGSTAVAAIHEGFHFIGIEAEAEYVAICEARIAHALKEVN